MEDDDDDDRADTLNLIMKFLLKLIKDVFVFPDNEYVRIVEVPRRSLPCLSKESVDIICNRKPRSKSCVCWKQPKSFIVLHRRITSSYLRLPR